MTTTGTTTTPAEARREIQQPQRTIAPRVDIYENDNMFVVLADMPGVSAGNVDVVAEGNSLTLRGRVERPAKPPDYQEFELADYFRAFTLTDDLETDGVKAALRDGVLRVEIPKSPRIQPKKIPVRAE